MPMQSIVAVKRAKIIVGVVLAALLLGGIIVLITRVFQASALAAATEMHAKQYVTTITPKAGGGGLPLTLPGTLQGINEATVYARTNGYMLRWTKDIGSSVRKGELLAEIATPEIDQELSPALAAQQQAASSESLGKTNVTRRASLSHEDAGK